MEILPTPCRSETRWANLLLILKTSEVAAPEAAGEARGRARLAGWPLPRAFRDTPGPECPDILELARPPGGGAEGHHADALPRPARRGPGRPPDPRCPDWVPGMTSRRAPTGAPRTLRRSG